MQKIVYWSKKILTMSEKLKKIQNEANKNIIKEVVETEKANNLLLLKYIIYILK